MAGVEGLLHLVDGLTIDLEVSDIHGALMHLADITHVEAALHIDLRRLEAIGLQMRHALLFELLVKRVDALVGRRIVEPQRRRGHVVVFDIGDDLPKGAEPRGELRQDDGIDAHLAGECRDVRRCRTTRPHQHEVARIVAAFHRDAADAVDHVAVDDGVHAVGGTLDGNPQWIGDFLHRLAGLLEIERQLAAEQAIGIEIAQHQIGIRCRRFGTALPVAGRPWFRARRLRADLDEAERVNPAD